RSTSSACRSRSIPAIRWTGSRSPDSTGTPECSSTRCGMGVSRSSRTSPGASWAGWARVRGRLFPMRQIWLAVILSTAVACAPKIVPAPVVTTPKFPEFLTPAVPASLEDSAAAISEDRGWRFLQTGDLGSAEREFALALRLVPAFYPAEASLRYVELAGEGAQAAFAPLDQTPAPPKERVGGAVPR